MTGPDDVAFGYLQEAVKQMTVQPMTLFLWEQVTPSVRAGRRYPALRSEDGTIYAEVTASQFIQGVTLETVNREGKRVGLWDATTWTHVNPTDTVRFEVPR